MEPASSRNKRFYLNSRRETSASTNGTRPSLFLRRNINMLGLIRGAQIPNYSRSLLSDMRLRDPP